MSPLERKPDAGKPHVRFDERGVETECMTGYSGTGNRKGRTPATAWPKHHRATPRLYKSGTRAACGHAAYRNWPKLRLHVGPVT
jgi:hypothetical protein